MSHAGSVLVGVVTDFDDMLKLLSRPTTTFTNSNAAASQVWISIDQHLKMVQTFCTSESEFSSRESETHISAPTVQMAEFSISHSSKLDSVSCVHSHSM